MYQKLSVAIIDLSFLNSKADTSMFYKKNANEFIVILVYVDDIFLIGSNIQFLHHVIFALNDKFVVKVLDDVHYLWELKCTKLPLLCNLVNRIM